ncbi:nitroreductase [Desulfatitalea alkaliphila]|uniref:Nitroreductase n=1 Tax=Desulfatitalea alkaliphila TaxID=2929485 RepID=A0AA41R4Z1_9BACT|nr:nitroreductase [Desulfatitalea alkaliphila]MCJ8501115.1 nitroreductase [Desulfatitalea alkaliphila]
MQIIDAIKTRKSVRGYKPDPVPKETIRQILQIAGRAPSAMNSQPWAFCVLGGRVLDQVRQANAAKLRAGETPGGEQSVVGWSKQSVYRERQVELAVQLFRLMGIERQDTDKRTQWTERGFRFFDAPAAIIVLTDTALKPDTPLIDIGIVIQTICLAALAFDLGTCIADQGCLYPDVLRRHAAIPDNMRIVMSIAIGYPDWDYPANQVQTSRVPIDDIVHWHGL